MILNVLMFAFNLLLGVVVRLHLIWFKGGGIYKN